MRVSFLLLVCAAFTGSAVGGDDGALLMGEDLSGWVAFSEPQPATERAPSADVWTLKQGVLRASGSPQGYLRTVGTYTSYELSLEWRWPETPGNSGVLLRVTGPDRVWPRSVEAQLKHGRAGDFYLMEGAPLETDASRMNPQNPRHRPHLRSAEKPAGEWNTYRIVVDGGRIALYVNGELVNEGAGAEQVAGHVALQSEGAPIEFRHIRLRPIAAPTAAQ